MSTNLFNNDFYVKERSADALRRDVTRSALLSALKQQKTCTSLLEKIGYFYFFF